MGRKLNANVLIGGRVYEAGTDESDIDGADTITADVWDGEGDETGSENDDTVTLAQVAELRERYDVALAESDEKIAALTAENEALKAELDATPAPGADYADLDLDALKAEIDRRNEGRDDAERIGKRGSAETLIAALVADDTAIQKG